MGSGSVANIKKLLYTILAQGIILCLSVVTNFFLPKYLGPAGFGYWQIYIFYLNYINLLGLGFNDGISLVYGGKDYSGLPYERLRGTFRVFLLYLAAVSLPLLGASLWIAEPNTRLIFMLLSLNIFPVCLFYAVINVFLATNQTYIYNNANLVMKIFSCAAYALLLVGGAGYAWLIAAELGIKLAVTAYCCYRARGVLWGRACPLAEGLRELKHDCGCGIQIMLVYILASLLPSMGRMVIEWREDITVYGQYAFALALLNFILLFTNALGVVVYPILKRVSRESRAALYQHFSFLYDHFVYLCLLLYAPIKLIILFFLPDYRQTLPYLPYLLAFCLPMGKYQLLLISYYKSDRRETALLWLNLTGVGVMAVAVVSCYLIWGTVLSMAAATMVVMYFWYWLTENRLFQQTEQKNRSFWWEQAIMTFSFLLSASLPGNWYFLAAYGAVVAADALIRRRRLVLAVKSVL